MRAAGASNTSKYFLPGDMHGAPLVSLLRTPTPAPSGGSLTALDMRGVGMGEAAAVLTHADVR